MLTADVTELEALLADDLLFVGVTGELTTKEMDLALYRSGATRFAELEPRELEIRVWSADFVLATAKIFVRGTFSKEDFAGDCLYARVWRREKNNWRIVAGGIHVLI